MVSSHYGYFLFINVCLLLAVMSLVVSIDWEGYVILFTHSLIIHSNLCFRVGCLKLYFSSFQLKSRPFITSSLSTLSDTRIGVKQVFSSTNWPIDNWQRMRSSK